MRDIASRPEYAHNADGLDDLMSEANLYYVPNERIL